MKMAIGYSIVKASPSDWDIINSYVSSQGFAAKYVVFDGFKTLENIKDYGLNNYDVIVTQEEVFEHQCNNILIKMFLAGDCEYLIVCHEDMLLTGRTLVEDVKNLIIKESINGIGIIGGRDGFWPGYTNMYGSRFSKSEVSHWLKTGEYHQTPLLNFGPIVYPRTTIDKIGLLDYNYKYAYAEQDFCLRAIKNGLSNYVLGMDLIHEKFGSINGIQAFMTEEGAKQIAKDRELLSQKWGI